MWNNGDGVICFQNEFPQQQYNFIYDSNGSFRLKQVSSVTENKYNVIWRKN